MSIASRQQAFLLSLTEALALSIQKALAGQPRQKGKLAACTQIISLIDELHERFPLALDKKQAARVEQALLRFGELQNADSQLHEVCALVGVAMTAVNHIFEVSRDRAKIEILSRLAQAVQNLYDFFDRRRQHLHLLELGARVGKRVVLWRV